MLSGMARYTLSFSSKDPTDNQHNQKCQDDNHIWGGLGLQY